MGKTQAEKAKPKKVSKMEEGKVLSPIKKDFSDLSRVRKDFSKEQKKFILDTLAPTLNENELLLFLYRSQKLGLNPLNGEIFAYISFETINGEKVRKLVMIAARDGKRKIAFKTGHLNSVETEAIYIKKTAELIETGNAKAEEKVIVKRVAPWEGGQLWGATCKITRDDFQEPFKVTVPLSEYNRKNRIWTSKPETMIKKVAQSQCFSDAFPELAGVYDEAERWDNNGQTSQKPLEIEGGDQPATEAQMATLKALMNGVKITTEITKSEAARKIRELAEKKGKK